jgi:hypothetical protein
MKPDSNWQNYRIKRSTFSFPNKRYLINFDEVYKFIGTEDKIEYFLQGHGVKIYSSLPRPTVMDSVYGHGDIRS